MAKQKYGYAESSALMATNWGAHMYSVVDEDNILENGMLVEKTDLVDAKDIEIYGVKNPEAGSEVVLILTPALIYDQSTTEGQAEYYFYIEPGVTARAYALVKDDRFAIADYMVTTLAGKGKPAVVGNYLVANSDRKYKEVAAEAFNGSTYGFVAKLEAIDYKSNLTLYRIRVIKNTAVA